MVARRDYAVRNFVPVPYFSLSAVLFTGSIEFSAHWKPNDTQPRLDEKG